MYKVAFGAGNIAVHTCTCTVMMFVYIQFVRSTDVFHPVFQDNVSCLEVSYVVILAAVPKGCDGKES